MPPGRLPIATSSRHGHGDRGLTLVPDGGFAGELLGRAWPEVNGVRTRSGPCWPLGGADPPQAVGLTRAPGDSGGSSSPATSAAPMAARAEGRSRLGLAQPEQFHRRMVTALRSEGFMKRHAIQFRLHRIALERCLSRDPSIPTDRFLTPLLEPEDAGSTPNWRAQKLHRLVTQKPQKDHSRLRAIVQRWPTYVGRLRACRQSLLLYGKTWTMPSSARIYHRPHLFAPATFFSKLSVMFRSSLDTPSRLTWPILCPRP